MVRRSRLRSSILMTIAAHIRELRAEIAEPALSSAPAAASQETVVQEQRAKQEDLDKALLEKRLSVQASEKSYASEIEKLGQREKMLLVERLTSLRNSAVKDIDYRFESRLRDFNNDGQKAIKKLEKYFEKAVQKKAEAGESFDAEDSVQAATTVVNKALNKLERRSEAIQEEIDAYGYEHTSKEENAAERSKTALQSLVVKAQEEIGSSFTLLDNVGEQDWEGQ